MTLNTDLVINLPEHFLLVLKQIFKMKNMIHKTFMVIVTILLFSSCEKYLDAKPDLALATPSTLKDLEAILNNFNVNNLCPNAGDIMSDDYYLEETTYKALTDVTARDTYIFGDQTYQDFDWQFLYSLTFKANVCLDGLDKIKVSAVDEYRANNIKGSALFLRAFALYHLVQTFSLPYQKAKANETLGVPLKLSSDLNEPIVRSSLEASYEAMIKDLTAAVSLLPNTRDYKTQPSKAACYGQLARIYLVMGDFENALKYADLGLGINGTLMDFNTLNATAQNPITIFNTEVDFNATSSGRGGIYNTSRARVNTVLYNSYASNDLRKVVFYSKNSNGSYAFKGDYVGRNNGQLFAGLTVDENLLIKAEAEVRLNKVNEGLTTLNKLLIKRWKTGTFVALTASNQADALKLVLLERRKELAFRCDLRWSDIKRLSFDAENSIVVSRTLGVDTYTLKVGDLRYASLIPLNTIILSGVLQNGR
jgi:tetratricopeptide (TPR) repeat protein